MVIDCRRLNAKLIKENYPLPLIEDQIDPLGGTNFILTSGVAGLLLQWANGDKKMVGMVGYYSKQTTYEQISYHSCELETITVVMPLKFFRAHLQGLEFKTTDCNALRTTFTKKDLIPE